MDRARICLLLLLVGAIGCSGASGSTFQAVPPAPGQAVIYVFRPSNSYAGSGVTLQIKCDGTKFGDLLGNGYVFHKTTPGRHVISCKTETTSEVPVEAVAGRSYYIQADVDMGFWVGRPRLVMVPEEQGRLAIAGTRSSMPKSGG